MKDQIKECPFCGGEVKVVSVTFGDSNRVYYRVDCGSHTLDRWDNTPEEAITAMQHKYFNRPGSHDLVKAIKEMIDGK